MKTKPEKKKKVYRGVVDARGVPRKTYVGALGEPGRFSVIGRGVHRGILHFST